MKRIALSMIAVLVLFSTVNCKDGANGTKTETGENVANVAKVVNTTASQVQDSAVLGKLYFVNLKEGEQPVMTGLSLSGNRCGTEEFNHKPYAAEGIRSVFELNEWVEFYLETSAKTGIKVMVFKHNADPSVYLKNALNSETAGFIQECELKKDPEAEENDQWGSFYLHPEEVEPGFYDFIFLYNNKVFATMLTKFYKPNELIEKPDSELEKLMKE